MDLRLRLPECDLVTRNLLAGFRHRNEELRRDTGGFGSGVNVETSLPLDSRYFLEAVGGRPSIRDARWREDIPTTS